MIIKTTAESFLSALKDLKVDKKLPIPVLGSVRVTNQQITATDLDNWTQVQFEGTGTADFLLPYHQTVGVLSGEKGLLTVEFQPGEITGHEHSSEQVEKYVNSCEACKDTNKYSHTRTRTVLCKEHKETPGETPVYGPQSVKLAVNGCEYTFESLPLTRWPQMPVVESEQRTVIFAEAFGTLLERTKFAISREESRYTLNGLKLEVRGETAKMIATDGHRLAIAETLDVRGADLDVLVSSSAVTWLYSKSGNLPVTISSNADHIRFYLGDKTLITRKMTGQFPNYQAVLPRQFSTIVNIPSADALGKTLTRVAKCADERSLAIRWSFDPENPSIKAESHERGKASAKVDCSIVGGFAERYKDSEESEEERKPITMGLNSSYVSEFLKLAGKEAVKVMLKDAQSAALFTLGDSWKYVVMPMRI